MSFWKKYRKLHIWLAVDLTVLGLYLALRQNQQLMNSFADHVTTPLKAALGRLCALTSLSIMEILYALAAVGAVAYTVWSVIAVVKARGHRGRRVYSALLGAADGILTVYVLFCLMWGVNYWTDSFQDRSGITAQPVAAEDLKNVTAYFAERLSETADTVPRDENGVYAVSKEQILSESRSVYGGVTELFPFLKFPDTRGQGSALLPDHERHGLYRGVFRLCGGVQCECGQPRLPAALHHRPRAGPPAGRRVGAGV